MGLYQRSCPAAVPGHADLQRAHRYPRPACACGFALSCTDQREKKMETILVYCGIYRVREWQ